MKTGILPARLQDKELSPDIRELWLRQIEAQERMQVLLWTVKSGLTKQLSEKRRVVEELEARLGRAF